MQIYLQQRRNYMSENEEEINAAVELYNKYVNVLNVLNIDVKTNLGTAITNLNTACVENAYNYINTLVIPSDFEYYNTLINIKTELNEYSPKIYNFKTSILDFIEILQNADDENEKVINSLNWNFLAINSASGNTARLTPDNNNPRVKPVDFHIGL